MKRQSLRSIVGYNVKYYRILIGFTQEKLAEKCELSPRYISDIENSKGNITLDTLEVIANKLKVNSHLLTKEQESKKLPKRVNMKVN